MPSSFSPPLRRQIITTNTCNSSPKHVISISSYNILAQAFIPSRKRQEAWCDWDVRRRALAQEISYYAPDIICLQELHPYHIKELADEVRQLMPDICGDVLFQAREIISQTLDEETIQKFQNGVGIMYNAKKFLLVDHRSVLLKEIAKEQSVVSAFLSAHRKSRNSREQYEPSHNSHLRINRNIGKIHCCQCAPWDPKIEQLKLLQVQNLLWHIELFAKDKLSLPLFICGDFNSLPSSDAYHLLRSGTVDVNGPQAGLLPIIPFGHTFHLRSAYAEREEPLSHWTDTFSGCLDYIWHGMTAGHSSASAPVLCSLVHEILPDEDFPKVGEHTSSMPNENFPSDHALLYASFALGQS